jgi:hypothetical protein
MLLKSLLSVNLIIIVNPEGSSLHNLPCNMEPNVAFFWKSPALILMSCYRSPTYVECKNFNFSNRDFHLELFKFLHKMNNNNNLNAQGIGDCNFSKHIGECIIVVAKMVGASHDKVYPLGPPFTR